MGCRSPEPGFWERASTDWIPHRGGREDCYTMILILNFACTDRSSRMRILKVKLAMCVISDSVIYSAVAQFSNNENTTASSTAVDPVCILKPIKTLIFFTIFITSHLSNHGVRMSLQRDVHTFAKKLFIFHRNSANQILLQLVYSWGISESINHTLNVTQLESCWVGVCTQVYLSSKPKYIYVYLYVYFWTHTLQLRCEGGPYSLTLAGSGLEPCGHTMQSRQSILFKCSIFELLLLTMPYVLSTMLPLSSLPLAPSFHIY